MAGGDLPKDLLEFKILINPVRLAIMTILFVNYRISASEVRRSLDITWGAFHSHINKLVQAKYLVTKRDFNGSKPVIMLYLEQIGAIRYRKFRQIWNKLSSSDD